MDPLAEKYPSLSPFVYCGNNPIIFFDPNGMEVRGDSADIEDAAKKINKALKDKNIKNAFASRKTKEVEKTGLEWLWALITGGSLTKTVHYLSLDGEGWNKISANDPLLAAEENSLATEAFKMLREIVNSKGIWKYHYTDVSPDGNSLAIFYGGGFNDGKGNIYVSPLGNLNTQSRNYGESSLGIFFHELVGHSHPNSKNASIMNQIFNTNPKSYTIPGHPGMYRTYKSWWEN